MPNLAFAALDLPVRMSVEQLFFSDQRGLECPWRGIRNSLKYLPAIVRFWPDSVEKSSGLSHAVGKIALSARRGGEQHDGTVTGGQQRLFTSFNLENHVPANIFLRSIGPSAVGSQ